METKVVTPFRVIASDELGMFKVAEAPSIDQLDSLACTIKWGEPIKERAIECMTITGDTPATALLAAGRNTGEIDIINPISGVLQTTIPPVSTTPSNNKDSTIVGIHFVPNNSSSKKNKQAATQQQQSASILSITQGGAIRLHTPQTDDNEIIYNEIRAWSSPPNVCCSAYDPESNLLAVGCQGAELRLFNVATGEITYAAKGGKPNAIRLVDPAWNTAVAFLPGSEGKKIIVGTGHHKLRLYDTSIGKRPQLDIAFGETRITALAPEPNGDRCWVANGLGQVEVYDFKASRFSGAIKGIAGSVRQLMISSDGKLIASAGLDRFLRIHNTQSRMVIGKVYLKSQLTGVGFVPMPAQKVTAVVDGDENGEKVKTKKKSSKKSKKEKRAAVEEDDNDILTEEDEEELAQVVKQKKKKSKKTKNNM